MPADHKQREPMGDGEPINSGAVELWRHADPESTQMWIFLQTVNKKYGLELESYKDLYQWSVENIAEFWEETWHFTGIKASRPFDQVLKPDAPMFPRPDFFTGSRLNFAENLLFPPNINIDPSTPAIIAATESTRSTVSWGELRSRVARCTASLRTLGIRPHDRIAGFLGNHANTVVAMLAATSLGAIWTAVSPDTGVAAVLDRLVQIEPVVLFADNGVEYNGRIHESITKTREIVAELKNLKAVVVFETVPGKVDIEGLKIGDGKAWTYEDFLQSATNPSAPLAFTQLPPDHPTYILYSSGTTGKPKCIIHSSLGTLIQHKKEHMIHCDIRPGDRFFYFTTCTWMMWHWLVSGLAVGATIILYDGSPFKPHSNLSMPLLISELKITQFGTSAKYLSILYIPSFPSFQFIKANPTGISEQNNIKPLIATPPVDLSSLRAIYSTGLGMAIASFSSSGSAILDGSAGDLVCTKPFPCQPVSFWGSDGAVKYHASYFDTFPGVWHHGDFIRLSPATSGLTMLGRSDGVLKPNGVRFGSSEIYNVLLKWFGEQVEDALCIGRRREGESDEVVVLFLKMREGSRFNAELADRVKEKIAQELSKRHVPSVVDECLEIPLTTNGKKIEVAVKQILCGMNVKTSASVANSECLGWYREWARTH
ncbi:hypothetical protein B7494_g4236 [Chlorociboria aeruginascens]|nr:hypothetical protein B7494_g4236 [Chlorociboria aeruginascens]